MRGGSDPEACAVARVGDLIAPARTCNNMEFLYMYFGAFDTSWTGGGGAPLAWDSTRGWGRLMASVCVAFAFGVAAVALRAVLWAAAPLEEHVA